MKFKLLLEIDKELSKTSRGFTYLPLSHQLGVMRECDICKDYMQQAYVVWILHRCVCPRCFNKWLEYSKTLPQTFVNNHLRFQQLKQDEWYEDYIHRMVIHDKGFYS